jgi:hypothetical protein
MVAGVDWRNTDGRTGAAVVLLRGARASPEVLAANGGRRWL